MGCCVEFVAQISYLSFLEKEKYTMQNSFV